MTDESTLEGNKHTLLSPTLSHTSSFAFLFPTPLTFSYPCAARERSIVCTHQQCGKAVEEKEGKRREEKRREKRTERRRRKRRGI